jgi:Mrp family chromosome partitioning ATPase
VDTPPIVPLADFELISAACQGVVMVVRAHYGEREILQKSASSVDRKKLLGFVFNGADANEKQYYGYKYEAKP